MRANRWKAALLLSAGAAMLLAGPVARAEVTDDDVLRAIERGREYLINLQNEDGSFTNDPKWRGCYSALCLMTLAYMGEHPNRPVMSRGLQYVMNLDPEQDFNQKQGYAVPVRVMALAYVHNKLMGRKQAVVRELLKQDRDRLLKGQNQTGGWRYLLRREDYDFSVTQWPLLAFAELARVGVEFPTNPLLAAREFYFRGQKPDGGWSYQFGQASYGSMTAAGLASLYIILDLAEPASGCPCRGGRSQRAGTETERRMDAAIEWITRNFAVAQNPKWHWSTNFDEVYYWLYSVERVGVNAGYKYFGQHDWYKEGAEFLVNRQNEDGSWRQIDPAIRTPIKNWGGGGVPDTCFALIFLIKGRAPVLFNKLRFAGIWNAHRRDIANLTRFIAWAKEQPFHWQIVDLAAPIEELHDAPILYVSAESPPAWGVEEKKKVREFTDTGGTLLVEASCGNPAVRMWFKSLAAEVWPEWPLEPLGADHPIYTEPYPLAKRPELMGIHDGLRTAVVYSMDDISCPWHTRAYAARDYLFQWGINLFTYAQDRAPLRAKLARWMPRDDERYAHPILAGPRKAVRIARLRHGGDWTAGANYGGFQVLDEHLRSRAGMSIRVTESNDPPLARMGVPASSLASYRAAYLAGVTSASLTEEDAEALKAYLAEGGFLWAEAVGGSLAFDKSFRQLAAAMGWRLKRLPGDHPLMSGQMGAAWGYDLTKDVKFRRALMVRQAKDPSAELVGVFVGDRLVGVYSPFDALFSTTGHEAYACQGYRAPDAAAVATNVVLYLTTRAGPGDGDAGAVFDQPDPKETGRQGPELDRRGERPGDEKPFFEERAPDRPPAEPPQPPAAPEPEEKPDEERPDLAPLPWQ